jgi:hypothetical protein
MIAAAAVYGGTGGTMSDTPGSPQPSTRGNRDVKLLAAAAGGLLVLMVVIAMVSSGGSNGGAYPPAPVSTVDPPPTDPDPTEPDPTHPPTTEPDPTEPPTTDPPATNPPQPEGSVPDELVGVWVGGPGSSQNYRFTFSGDGEYEWEHRIGANEHGVAVVRESRMVLHPTDGPPKTLAWRLLVVGPVESLEVITPGGEHQSYAPA